MLQLVKKLTLTARSGVTRLGGSTGGGWHPRLAAYERTSLEVRHACRHFCLLNIFLAGVLAVTFVLRFQTKAAQARDKT